MKVIWWPNEELNRIVDSAASGGSHDPLFSIRAVVREAEHSVLAIYNHHSETGICDMLRSLHLQHARWEGGTNGG